MASQHPSLSNLQLELLKTFSHELTEEELLEIRKLLAEFFAKRAIEEANRVWDEEQWDKGNVDEFH